MEIVCEFLATALQTLSCSTRRKENAPHFQRRKILLIETYFDTILAKIKEVKKAEMDNIAHIAEICAHSIQSGGVVHVYDTGHIINSELISRAGGLVGMTPFSFGMNVSNPNLFRDKQGKKVDVVAETVSLALKQSNIRPGDVLFIGSVSGKSEQVVELAIQAKEMGVTTIGTTSVTYSSKLESQHPSGKKLFEVAEIVLDNHAPYGDAMLTVEGLDVPVCPASGISATVMMWAISAGIVELLLANGITPTVFRSANTPGGMDDMQGRNNTYKENGY